MNISMEGDGSMNNDKPMPILLIEDELAEHRKFKECADGRTDVNLIGMTVSSGEGLQIVKNRLPEGVILDMELSKGEGHGLQFLTNLKETRLRLRPIVVVTTNIQSEVMYDRIHDIGASFVFSKKQKGYTPDLVFDMLMTLRQSLPYAQTDDLNSETSTAESPEEQRARVLGQIDAEFDGLGISRGLKGRNYLRETVFLQANRTSGEPVPVIDQVAALYRVNYNSVIRAIQTAIERTWETTDIDTLKEKYPVHINMRTGVPAPTEFIRYYADKLRNIL
jgi:CheY-like chemotaxis protein